MKNQLLMLSLGICLLSGVYAQSTVNELTFGPKQEASSGKTLDGIVAVVGEDVITRRELSAFRQQDRKAGLQNLIMSKLLLQAAKKYNINVGDTAVNVAAKGKGAGLSRKTLQDKLMIEKLQQQIAATYVQISDMEIADMVDKQLRQSEASVRLVDMLVSVPKSTDPEELNKAQMTMQEVIEKLKTQSENEVASQYQNVHYNELGWVQLGKIPPLFSKVLIGAELNQYNSPIVDSDGIHLLKILNRKGGATGVIPEVKVSHILIRDKDNPQAEQTINQLYQQLQKGIDFSLLAAQFSQDPGSATGGGDLGWVRRGQMVPSFEQVMLNTPTGKMSKPFKSRFGYHILKVEKRRQAPVDSRKLLEARARQAIFQRRAAEEWDMWLARLREESHVEIRDENLQ